MGTRRQAPKPPKLVALRGNPGHRTADQLARTSLRARPAVPVPPTWLSREAKAEWRRITPELDELGLLAKMDRAVLSLYCTWWAKFCELERHLRGLGVTVEGRRAGESVKPPAWSMWKDASDRVLLLAKELGVTPMVRLKTDLPSPSSDEDDDSDGILD